MTSEALVAPSEVWLAAQVDDDWSLTPQERNRADQIEADHGNTMAKAALGLAASFMLYRAYAERQMKKHQTGPADRKKMGWTLRMIWASFGPTWMRIVTPHLVTGYLIGVAEAHAGAIPENQLLSIAESYAKGLGEEIHKTSADAVMIGYQAQINRKIPAARAVQQVAAAYGVAPRAMNTLVAVWNSEDPKKLTNLSLNDVKDERIRHLIEAELKNRGRLIGDNETWAAKTQAKQIVWMYGVQEGVIPSDAKRTWITAKDEKVCPYCGPLHETKVGVKEKFKTDAGNVWSPPLHPRCRCNITLDFTTDKDFGDELKALLDGALVVKSFGDDPYDRDKHGRFASREGRSGTPGKFTAYKEPDPAIANLIREAQAKYGVPDAKKVLLKVEGKSDQAKKRISGTRLSAKIESESKRLSSGKLSPLSAPSTPKLSGKSEQRLGTAESIKLTFDKLKAPSPQKIRSEAPAKLQGDIYTEDGARWQALDSPLFGLSSFDEAASGTILTDENNELVDAEDVPALVSQHWLDVHREIANAFEDEERDSPGTVLHFSNTAVIVTDEDWDAAIDAAITGNDDGDRWLDSVMTESDDEPFAIPISPIELAQLLRVPDQELTIAEYVRSQTPLVFVMMHGKPGSTDISYARHGYSHNPGKWAIAGRYENKRSLSDLPYEVRYVEPID